MFKVGQKVELERQRILHDDSSSPSHKTTTKTVSFFDGTFLKFKELPGRSFVFSAIDETAAMIRSESKITKDPEGWARVSNKPIKYIAYV